MLDRVSQSISSASASTLISSSSAASSSASSNSSFLVHHTRNTASKQWAETQVIVLGGVARVFQTRLDSLCQLDGFERVWSTLLDNIKECACSPSNEVRHNFCLVFSSNLSFCQIFYFLCSSGGYRSYDQLQADPRAAIRD